LLTLHGLYDTLKKGRREKKMAWQYFFCCFTVVQTRNEGIVVSESFPKPFSVIGMGLEPPSGS